MDGTNNYSAPWSKEIKLMTALCLFVCFGVAGIGLTAFSEAHLIARFTMIGFPLCLLFGALFFLVRGYSITDDKLIIHRLGWKSILDLDSLKSVVYDPDAMTGSTRTVGNGGLFSFCGWFQNDKLGSYRVFGTDPRRSVVLRFPDRIVVVTPDSPAEFVNTIEPKVSTAT